LRDRLQLGVNRLMYGRRDEPVTVLSQLGARLEETMVPDEILPRLVDTVVQALKLPYAAIALKVAEQFKIQAEGGHATGRTESFLLIYQGETIGQLVVARRAPDEDFNHADRLLLTNIARQAGAVAHSVRLTAALQQSRQQLVTAREEERRRIRRDLHDGLGPTLANMAMRLEQARESLPPDASESDALLAALTAQAQTTITDIRRLVYELRPPDLDEYGLVSALREYLHRIQPKGTAVTLTAPEARPALPAAVEVAAYRIVQEAVNNAVKHAKADTIKVVLILPEAPEPSLSLHIEVCDNGIGLPVDHPVGIGLHSMRERAEELGGSCHIGNRANGGVQVVAQLPIG
jgi:signal transduction histidine kinase